MTTKLLTDGLRPTTQDKKQNSCGTRVVQGEEVEEIKNGLEIPEKGR